MSINLILIAVIVIVSFAGFNKPELVYRYQFNAWQIHQRKEYHRLITHAFFHGGWTHLLVNMFVLWSFSDAVVHYFSFITPSPQLTFLFFFFTACVASSIYDLFKYRSNHHYNAIGASGGVAAVVFASILFNPYQPIYLFAIVPIPGIIFGVVYLVYSGTMARRDSDNIAHDAHFWGAVYGFLFPILVEPSLLRYFIDKLISF